MGKKTSMGSLQVGASDCVIPGSMRPDSYQGPAPAFPMDKHVMGPAPRGSYENVIGEGVRVTDALFSGCASTPVAKLTPDEVSHLIAQAPAVKARAVHNGGHHVEETLPSGRKVWGTVVGTDTAYTHWSPRD